MALTTSINFRATGTLTKTVGAILSTLGPTIARNFAWASGVAIDQADKAYYARPTIAGSATLSLDLAGTTLEDMFGDAFAIAKLKCFALSSDLTLCPNQIVVLKPTNGVPWLTGATGAGVNVPPGGSLLWVAPTLAGIAVTAGTGDLIDIQNSAAGSVQPEILIIGASA
jgi:hypothetical protein